MFPYSKHNETTAEIASFLVSLKHEGEGVSSASTSASNSPLLSPQPTPFLVGHDYRLSSLELPTPARKAAKKKKDQEVITVTASTIDLPALIEKSSLVKMKDRELVPDALFVAMAQMEPCQLTQADRVGCYKQRPLGFVGMACQHCGGQPGFGRFFPNSIRSLSQTTTSQTIVKHIRSKCRFCPPHVRQAVLFYSKMQDEEMARQQQSSNSSSRPRYGSRKIFFNRVWNRLHGESGSKDPPPSHFDDVPPPLKEEDDDDSRRTPSLQDEEEGSFHGHKQVDAIKSMPFSVSSHRNGVH